MTLNHICTGLILLAAACLMSGQPASAQNVNSTAAPGHHHHGHYRTVCYTTGWSQYRKDPVQFVPEDIDTSLCTHLIFAFALLDNSTGTQLVPADPPKDIEMYQRTTALKREQPKMKVMLSVGGWNMGSHAFSKMVSTTANMHAFARNAIEYLHRYNFDGLDIDWEYPADRGSPAQDKEQFTKMLQIVDHEFHMDHAQTNRTNLLLSVAIAPSPFRIRMSYELSQIAKNLDFINLMTYDFHGTWDKTVGHHSTLYSPTSDKTDSIDYVINWILNTTVPKHKLNLGLAFYGNSFNLTDPTDINLGAAVTGPGAAGNLLHARGTMAYYEVCKLLTEHSDTVTEAGHLPGTQAPYVVDGSRWTGYDDVNSIQEKVAYAMDQGLGGVFIWSIDLDDFHGICGGGHYPLMNAIHDTFRHHSPIVG